MKNIITLLSFILIITSCDVVEGPYEIDTGAITPTDTNIYVKKILIEDFTGHTCFNCPAAAIELEAIHDVYGDQIIGMALHVSKSFARPMTSDTTLAFWYDFRTKWGDDWDAFYGISDAGLPRGMVNRVGDGLLKEEWANAVVNELAKDPDFGININTITTSSITIVSKVLENVNGDYNLVVCLTENNIITWQKDEAGDVEDYEHNHVLRAVLVDETLSNFPNYVAGQQIEKTINYDLTDLEDFNIDYSTNTAELGNGHAGGWDASNMSVIAYIYNSNTNEIVQVEESHLMNN